MIIPLILAGGSGTRLWPLSRELLPKQLLNLDNKNKNSMLQNTILRFNALEIVSPPIVVCNEEHRFIVAEQLRTIDVKPLSIILEPIGKNTAPAICVGVLKAIELFKNDKSLYINNKLEPKIFNKEDGQFIENIDPVLLILPADHTINNIKNFHESIMFGYRYALEGFGNSERGFLITFGIIPNVPETGYGYIKKGKSVKELKNFKEQQNRLFFIDRFIEKPDLKRAKSFIASGEYFWNSGMFMFKASQILKELELYEPDMVQICRESINSGKNDLDFFRLDSQTFKKCKEQSIDYAVMEKTDKGAIIPIDVGWSDLGSWEALWQNGKKDENNNVVKGDVLLSDVENSYIHAQNRFVAAIGLKECVIVETKDAVLVSPKDRVQDVKKIVAQLKKNGRDEAVLHSKVFRPWGSYETIDLENRFQVKRITVKPGAKLSLQKHYHRAEHWTVVSGTAIITKDNNEIMLTENESTYIPPGTIHRLENPGKIPLELIEVQSGSYLGEDDIVRIDDLYGR